MKKITVAFDVDETLISETGKPLYETIAVLKYFSKLHSVRVRVWSGGGKDYAEYRVHTLGLDEYVDECMGKLEGFDDRPDLTFDDQIMELGKVNIQLNKKE